jgi:hypothetical protein
MPGRIVPNTAKSVATLACIPRFFLLAADLAGGMKPRTPPSVIRIHGDAFRAELW